jgi:hypothetical protein
MPAATPEDDLTHEPDDDPDWRESWAYSVYDDEQEFGMWHSIGKKPNKGYSGFSLGTWGSDILCTVKYDQFEDHVGPHIVDGLTYECLEPNERWRLTFDGELARAPDKGGRRVDTDLFDTEATQSFEQVPVSFDLEWEAGSPSYRYYDRKSVEPMFSGHLDQTGLTSGTVEIDGNSMHVEGYGVRDHSWGTRNWQWPAMWRYVTIAREDFHLMLWYIESTGGNDNLDGFVYTNDELISIIDYEETLTTDPHPEKPIPHELDFEVTTEADETYSISAEVKKIHPIIISNTADGEEIHSWNDRSHVEFRLPNGDVVPGEIEFSKRVETWSG